MPVTIQAHFDGKVIVPDEPVKLPINQGFRLTMDLGEREDKVSDAEWHEALERLMARGVHGLNIPDEALRRENLY